MKLISSMCWCQSSEVAIPVGWVSVGQTGSCGDGCGPGCESKTIPDEFDVDPWDAIPPKPKAWRMGQFDPSKYHPAHDTTPGLPVMADAVGLLVGSTLCPCGCGTESANSGTRFCMGHDVRLKGILIRAASADARIVLYNELDGWVEMETLSPLSYADRFSTDKVDWRLHVQTSVGRIISRRAKKGLQS